MELLFKRQPLNIYRVEKKHEPIPIYIHFIDRNVSSVQLLHLRHFVN